jgi:hypothetical protein
VYGSVDTDSAHTVISAGILDELGYSPRQGEAIATVRTAVGKEQGYLLRVSRSWALGFSVSDVRVIRHRWCSGAQLLAPVQHRAPVGRRTIGARPRRDNVTGCKIRERWQDEQLIGMVEGPAEQRRASTT